MKIALLGYGKMGKTIESVAQERQHQVVAYWDKDLQQGNLNDADVAINFSTPDAAVVNIKTGLDAQLPVICGTTGWLGAEKEIHDYCSERQGAFLYASNFSIGVNLFFKLNKQLAQWMQAHEDYKVHLEETHHTQKLDAPSGTALQLAEDIIAHSAYNSWELNTKTNPQALPISAHREGEVPGIHDIQYSSTSDKISLRHEAFSRKGFALGAIIAAEWIIGKKGIFKMEDVLKLS
jgi:4-hydroxy-tetrahydrodipicolinate reductase